MCGIAGAFSRADVREAVSRMDAELAHRGPDDAGTCVLCQGERVVGAFAHRRLSILDVSAAGHQPMVTPDGRWTITFNGEIYNFRELRDDLARDGVCFHTNTDTEVLLHGVARHGRAFLGRLRGMFAAAIWDRAVGCGYLLRDPFGIKPLFVAEVNGSVLFASELRAVLASGKVARRLSRDAVSSYLRYGSATEPQSMLEDVFALPSGTIAVVELTDSGARVRTPEPYSLPRITPREERITDTSVAVRHIRDALAESVRKHLVSDVPVGIFLSGGIDSSTIAALAHDVSDRPLDSFTIDFRERGFSEASVARDVAKRFGTRHHEITLSARDLLGMLPGAFEAMDQPSMDGLNTFAISRVTRDFGLKVVLSGLGGDELFGGYPSFRRAMRIAQLRWMPPLVRRAGAALVPVTGIAAEKLQLLVGDGDPAFTAYHASRVLFTQHQIARLCGVPPDDSYVAPPPSLSLFGRVSWFEMTGYMLNTLLRDSDIFSMACGLELRVPFVDLAVAGVSASVDDRLRDPSQMNKPLLVQSVRDLLPASVWNRPKQGFTLPFEHWLRDELRDETERTFTDSAFARVGLDARSGRQIWQGFLGQHKGITWSRPWSLYTLLRWASEHDVWVGDAPRRHRPRAAALNEVARSPFLLAQPGARSARRTPRPISRGTKPSTVHLWAPGMFAFKGGIQVYQHDLLHALRAELPDARLRVFSKNDASVPDHERDLLNVDFHCTGGANGRVRTAQFVSRIVARAVAERPDLVVVGHLNFASAAFTLKRTLGIPYWIVAYGVEAWDLRHQLARQALHAAELIVSISEHTRTRLLREQQLDPSRVVLLPPTFDDGAFQPGPKPRYLLERYGLRDDQPVILTVARLAGAERYKGYDQIVTALPQIRESYPGVRYIIAGTGDDRSRVEAVIGRLGVRDNVTLAGFVPDSELCDHYNLCDVFAMPSKREGFGIVYVEAMACGKPVLGGNQDGAVDALNRGEFGVLVDPDDVQIISRQLIALLRGDRPAPLIGDPQALRRAVVDRFGPSTFLTTLRGHLEGVFDVDSA